MSPRRLRSGGSVQRNDAEPVVEVVPELPRSGWPAGGRGWWRRPRARPRGSAGSAPTRLISPDSSARSSLAWRSSGQLADLVQEQRAAVRLLERALVRADRAGERALLVAEQLALDELLADRRAVHRDERALGARAAGVDGAGDQLLAGARLAENRHRRGRGRHALDELDEHPHRRSMAHQTLPGRRRRPGASGSRARAGRRSRPTRSWVWSGTSASKSRTGPSQVPFVLA